MLNLVQKQSLDFSQEFEKLVNCNGFREWLHHATATVRYEDEPFKTE